jgi:hypothetical protein
MKPDEEEVRNTLDKLFKEVKVTKDLEKINELSFAIDDYIEQGYDLRDYIHKYNELLQDLKI